MGEQLMNEMNHSPKRATGIEPITTVWKTIVLPLNYARDKSQPYYECGY